MSAIASRQCSKIRKIEYRKAVIGNRVIMDPHNRYSITPDYEYCFDYTAALCPGPVNGPCSGVAGDIFRLKRRRTAS